MDAQPNLGPAPPSLAPAAATPMLELQLGASPWLGVAAEASPDVLAANGRALALVRKLLAASPAPTPSGAAARRPQATTEAATLHLSHLLAHFQLLVAADGPLPFVRFDAPAFAAARQSAARGGAAGKEADADACLAILAPLASAKLRASLQAFVAQPFVPPGDRLAAVAALVTWALETPVPLALYAIFAAQLADADADADRGWGQGI